MKLKKTILVVSIIIFCGFCFTACKPSEVKIEFPEYNAIVKGVSLKPADNYNGILETLQIYLPKNEMTQINIFNVTNYHLTNLTGWNFFNDFKYNFDKTEFNIYIYIVVEYGNNKGSMWLSKAVFLQDKKILFEETQSNFININCYNDIKTNLTLTMY